MRGVLGSIFACEANGRGSTPLDLTNFASEATVDGQLAFNQMIRVGSTPTRRTNFLDLVHSDDRRGLKMIMV